MLRLFLVIANNVVFLTLGQFIVTEMQSSKDEIELTSFEESVDKQYTNIVIEQETDGVG